MTIEELEDKSLDLSINIKNEEAYSNNITKLSIQFAVEVLEDLEAQNKAVFDKIQELKQYLDESM